MSTYRPGQALILGLSHDARWQAYDEQAQAGECECCACGGHNDRPCIVCGHYLRDCRHCHRRITMLGGSWTDPDGCTGCLDNMSDLCAPHQPA